MPADDAVATRLPAQVPPPLVPGLRGLLTLAVSVVLIAALYLGREVFIPLVLAVLLSFVLAPVVNLLRRLRLGRILSVIVAVLLALGVIGGIGDGHRHPGRRPCRQPAPVPGHRAEEGGGPAAGLARRREPHPPEVQPPGARRDPEGRRRRHDRRDRAGGRDAQGAARAGRGARALAPGAGREGARPHRLAVDRRRHRPRRRGVPAPAAGGPAQPHDPPVRVERPAPHDGGHGRRGAAGSAPTSWPSSA